MRLSIVSCFSLAIIAAAAPSPATSLSANAKGLFMESMQWMDRYYDARSGYLYDFSSAAGLTHASRSSVWYAFGLLTRNTGHDVAEAEKIIRNVIRAQYKDPADEWYATYQQHPEEPEVGSPAYPPTIYGSWDPNWRGFVGTTFIMALEEYPHLLSSSIQDLILESLYNATKGDEYRFGHADPSEDNLYPAYSNPSIMRAFVSGWTGRRLQESNMTKSGEKYAQDIVDLFDRDNTLSEFNSGTYTGVSLFGLLLWSKYLPADSVMAKAGPRMIRYTWRSVGELWHPGLRNMAGPWDRAYGYDMNRYLSLMALWLWTLIGKENSSLISHPEVMSHMADFAWAPLFAVLAAYHETLVPEDVLQKLKTFQGEHTFTSSTYYPPFDKVPRNITSWLSDRLMVGAESYDEISLGGPSRSQVSFNPAVVQWDTGHEIAFLSLYPTETALQAQVSPGQLVLSYPRGNSSSIFSLLVSSFTAKRTVSGLEDIQGLSVKVSGNADQRYALSFAGHHGGASAPIRDFEFWNFTYTMPPEFEGTPSITLGLSLV